MNVLFFIVLPLATILIALVLQKLLRSPILVALLVFAVYLILAFTVFDANFLINAMIYSILAFLTALFFKFICCIRERINCGNNDICSSCNNNNENASEENITGLQNSIIGLERSMASLEKNIASLTELLSNLTNNNNNNCGCNRSYKR